MSKKGLFSPGEMRGLGIIQGWKAIGQHLGRSGRTARRWYDNYSMPIRQAITGRPFAFIHELDLWMIKVDELIKKKYSEGCDKDREHATYMRSCKKKKANT